MAGTYTITVLPALMLLFANALFTRPGRTNPGALKVQNKGADGPRTGSYGAMAARWIPDPKVGGSNPSSFTPFLSPIFFPIDNAKKTKKSALPKLGIAPRLPRPQRGVLLLDYFGATAYGGSGYRSRFSTLRRLYATMYNNPPHRLRPSGLEPESYPWKG